MIALITFYRDIKCVCYKRVRLCSYERMTFLFGRMEKSASEFYNQYVQNNEIFAGEPLRKMSKVTQNLMRSFDYEHIKERRTQNFMFLHELLSDKNLLKLSVPDGAFAYPLYIENGAELRKQLQQKKIYIPTLWPDVFNLCKEGDLEYDMAKNILPIPVDQRYGMEDMQEIIDQILNIQTCM